MTLAALKPIRVVLSLAVTGVVVLLFVDISGVIPPEVARTVTAFQVLPALLKCLGAAGLWMGGALSIVLLTLLFGRVYCSTLCPVGTLQDLISRLPRRINRRHWFAFRKPMYGLHYGVLALTLLLVAFGNLTLLNLLEPFSNFGRILASLIRPIVVGINNLLASVLSTMGIYVIAQVPLHAFGWGAMMGSLGFLSVVAIMAYRSGRLFCNTLCPAGALLSVFSRFSLFKIVVDHGMCLDCGLCERVCKAGCIDTETKTVSYAACVGCFNCFKVCPTDGLRFVTPWSGPAKKRERRPNAGRRRIITASIVPLFLFLRPTTDSSATAREIKKSPRPVTPPGALGEHHFTVSCTACHLCVSACPSQVLVPTFLTYGVSGVFQPEMDYQAGYCNYECTICGTICPSGAIISVDQEAKKLIQIGQARFLKDECVVVKNKKDCGACSEHCPTKAVKMVPYEVKLFIPELDNELCVGCGACEHSCPTKPQKAIYVEANVVHRAAKKPEIKKLESTPVEEFPF